MLSITHQAPTLGRLIGGPPRTQWLQTRACAPPLLRNHAGMHHALERPARAYALSQSLAARFCALPRSNLDVQADACTPGRPEDLCGRCERNAVMAQPLILLLRHLLAWGKREAGCGFDSHSWGASSCLNGAALESCLCVSGTGKPPLHACLHACAPPHACCSTHRPAWRCAPACAWRSLCLPSPPFHCRMAPWRSKPPWLSGALLCPFYRGGGIWLGVAVRQPSRLAPRLRARTRG